MFENFKFFFYKKNRIIENINFQILNQSRNSEIYINYNIKDTFQNRLNLQILHLSLILINKYGEPTFTGAFNKNVYYQNETTRILPAGKKEFISRKILALKINDEGVIVKKEILNLDDGILIKPTSGKTETAGSDLTIFQQIFLNLRSGRFQSTD